MKIDLNKEDLEKAVVERAVDELLADEETLRERIRIKVEKLVTERVSAALDKTVESALSDALKSALSSEISPVNAWGEPTGESKTLREVLYLRSVDFWNEKVGADGKKSSAYGAKPRHEHMLQEVMAKEFSKAIKQNMVDIAGALKDSIRESFYKKIDIELDGLFKVRSKVEQDRKNKRS